MKTFDGHTLRAGYTLINPIAQIQYIIDRRLGQGGFGTAYLAKVKAPRANRMPRKVCIKLTNDLRGWINEAYFGYLLESQDRALVIHDVFPVPSFTGWYAITSEYAEHGDLVAYLHHRGHGWPESRARREVAHLLRVLDVLHKGGALHRDLTPFNVFVCGGERLKLGDFGIAKHSTNEKGVPAGTMAPWMAPTEIVNGQIGRWAARDDVYQVGQLLSMLVSGNTESTIKPREVRHLICSDETKEIILRCIGRRGKRYGTASELIVHLRAMPNNIREGKVISLKGKAIVFTGRLSISRDKAAQLAERAGATVHRAVSPTTEVIVQGRANNLQAAGARGQKLVDVAMWRERGVDIKVIREAQFMRLVS